MGISEQKSWVNIGIISLSRQDAEKSKSHICNEAIEVLLKSQVWSNSEIVVAIGTGLNTPTFGVKWALSHDFRYPTVHTVQVKIFWYRIYLSTSNS